MSTDDDTAMDAEFDTVAEWTAEAALALGPDHYVPAGCRGSGRPGALDWLLDRMAVRGGRLLDVGAGVGGPAAYAAHRTGVAPLLLEPAAGATRAARRLFALPIAQADATALPVRDAAVRYAWCLGVLCTTDEQVRLLAELRRVLRPDGRAGLLVFVAERPPLSDPPAGNDFPTPAELDAQVRAAGLTVAARALERDMPTEPADWTRHLDAVEDEMERRHGRDPAWRTAQDQSAAIGRLLSSGELAGHLLVVRPDHGCSPTAT